jgi:hypothetical protein
MIKCLVGLLTRPWFQQVREKLDTDPQYLAIGIQYYIAGRSATFAGLIPVTGNLFHHAVEMFLKYFLLKSHPRSKLKYQFRHSLPKLWRAFKKIANEPSLNKFNGLVSALDKVEGLRYPTGSYIFTLSVTKDENSPASGPGVIGFEQYNFSLEEIDEFVTAILKGRVAPGWISALLVKDEAKSQYLRENQHPFFSADMAATKAG